MKSYQIEEIGGNCPVQAEGHIGGKTKFYFRARGEHWTLGIGREPVDSPDWEYGEDYGTWPDAGWMTVDEARAFIDKAIKIYWGQKSGREPHNRA